MSSIDDVIKERLQKLRNNDLKDSKSTVSTLTTQNITLLKKDKPTAAQQVDDLLDQLSAETNIEAKLKKSEDIDADIRNRLEKLKSREGCNFRSKTAAPSSPVVSAIDNDGILDEELFNKPSCSALLNLGDYSDSESDKSCDSDLSDPEDLKKLCIICDKKPSLICLQCDKDFYCNMCFKEFHYPEERHKTLPFPHNN